jgi:hypothetical protein
MLNPWLVMGRHQGHDLWWQASEQHLKQGIIAKVVFAVIPADQGSAIFERPCHGSSAVV